MTDQRLTTPLSSRRSASKTIYVLLALPAIFWLMNRLPFLQIGAISLGLGLFAVVTVRRFRLNAGSARAVAYVTVIGVYFLYSYLLSGQSLTEFFSYGFLRRDGNFFFAYTPFFIFSLAAARPDRIARFLFHFAVASAFLIGTVGIIEYVSGYNGLFISADPSGSRFFYAFNHAHNAAGSLYAIAFLLGLSLLLFGTTRTRRTGLAVAVLFTCLVLTKSRGAFLAAVPSAFYLLYLRYGGRVAMKRSVVLAAIGLPLFLAVGGLERILTVVDMHHPNNQARIYHWIKASALFVQSPLIGIGFGRYDDYDPATGNLKFRGIPGVIYIAVQGATAHTNSHAHNSYLHLLAETGLVGLGLVGGFWIYCFRRIRAKFQRSRASPNFERMFFAATMASIICLAFLSLTEHHMTTPTTIIVLASLTATALNLRPSVPVEGLTRRGHVPLPAA